MDSYDAGSDAGYSSYTGAGGMDEEQGKPTTKRRRIRAALSCVNCQARKIKCSRTCPCENCIQRGMADSCHWESTEEKRARANAESANQTSSSTAPWEHAIHTLRLEYEARLSRIEGLLSQQQQVQPQLAPAPVFSPARSGNPMQPDAAAGTTAAAGNASANMNVHPQNGSVGAKPQQSSSSSHSPMPGTTSRGVANPGQQQGSSIFGQNALTASPSTIKPVQRKEEAAEDAAMALEALAAGHTPGGVLDEGPASEPLPSKEAFAYESILDRNFQPPVRPNPKLPWLGLMTPRTLADSLITILESKQNADRLLMAYSEVLVWLNGTIHLPSFLREYQAFWTIAGTLDQNYLDPAWLALFATIMASTARVETDWAKELLADDLTEVARTGLYLANYTKVPQFRTVQACIMLSIQDIPGVHHSSSHIYHSIASQLSQTLGLHRLGSDPTTMPLPDKSVPTGSLLHREMAVRIWTEIVSYDWTVLASLNKVYSISPTSFTTGLPANYSEEDLDDWSSHRAPRPLSEKSKGSLLNAKAQTAEFFRKLADLGDPPASDSADMSVFYATLLVLDKEFKSRLEQCLITEPCLMEKGIDIVFAIIFHSRRLALHRLLGLRSYKDRRFAASARIATECAQKILELLTPLSQIKMGVVISRYLHKHITSAVLLLFMNVYHDVDLGATRDMVDSKLASVPAAVSMFDAAEKSGVKQAIELASKGKILINALKDYLTERLDKRGQGSPEDHADVLRRIARKIGKQMATPNNSTCASTPLSASSHGGGCNSNGNGASMGLPQHGGHGNFKHLQFGGGGGENHHNGGNSNLHGMSSTDDNTQYLLATLGLLPPNASAHGGPGQAAFENTQMPTPDFDIGAMWNYPIFDGQPNAFLDGASGNGNGNSNVYAQSFW